MATIAERFEQLLDCEHQVDRDALVCRSCGQTVIDVWDDDGE